MVKTLLFRAGVIQSLFDSFSYHAVIGGKDKTCYQCAVITIDIGTIIEEQAELFDDDLQARR